MKLYILFFFLISTIVIFSQKFTDVDRRFGSNLAERDWWDVRHYDLRFEPDFEHKTLKGKVIIRFIITKEPEKMQIDLYEGLQIDSIKMTGQNLSYQRDGRFCFIDGFQLDIGSENLLEIFYSGTPLEAKNPPWDGGFVWALDKESRPWMSVACQGIGASCWFPCKDYNGDEADEGATISAIIDKELKLVAGGNPLRAESYSENKKINHWRVRSAINVYNIIPYIGNYLSFHSDFQGEKGILKQSYWVLDYNLERAQKHFMQTDTMLGCFEHWFGPYPFYEDGYKLVESPYLGMEHQSAIAYGNDFRNGYFGSDLSGSGVGLKWDFIIVHESGHEWFGNSISAIDVADMWIHEAFTNYSETLYTGCQQGKEAALEYVYGIRKLIKNDIPIIGVYGVRNEGSGDMYYKGGNIIHMLRAYIADDEKFRSMLRELNTEFYHKTVSSQQIESYIQKYVNFDLNTFFDVYLRSADLPVLEIKIKRGKYFFRWSENNKNLLMPLKLTDGKWICPSDKWQKFKSDAPLKEQIHADFYIDFK